MRFSARWFRQQTATQFFRYAVVGVLTNVGGYLVYLLITEIGIEPKKAMTGLYLVGALIGFAANRQWTFFYRGTIVWSLVRYGMAHALGYLLNLALLIIFIDRFGYPHQWVQAVAIFLVAFFLFIMFRLFVFPFCENSGEGAR